MDSIQKTSPDQRDISSLTLGVSKKTYAHCKNEIKEFKDRIKRIVEQDKKSDRVYNLNIQLFPLSQPFTTNGDAP
jgi:uncharacterized protein (TIGR02147 family)